MNQFTNAAPNTRIQAVDLTASAGWFITVVLLTIATFASAASWDDD
jgi:hypothetical protein